uniref:Beta_propel domain protein n=1 Tax=uncultured marine crenarchaeote E48-1C TaxID=907718 RepID=G9BAS5_9ARCH|nr:Beta_propel domain protein [uncultured marine crenarchaeote E48-1C]
MESRIKKRAQIYGIAAIILAVSIGTLCYNLGIYPESSGPSQGRQHTHLQIPSALLNTFTSYEELRDFLERAPYTAPDKYDPIREALKELWGLSAPNELGFSGETQGSGSEYSTTNIQVEGVDEADIVKTDGEHLYVVSGANIYILKAYPTEEAEVLSHIAFNTTYPAGIFVNSDRLAVLGCKHANHYKWYYESFYDQTKTSLVVYDITNRSTPTKLTNFTISGGYFSSRMIDEYVYFVVNQQAHIVNDTVLLPRVYSEVRVEEISATEIQYFNTSDSYYKFTTIVAINLQDITQEPTNKTILLGGASCMYVSLNNIYITFPKGDSTFIYRFHIDNDEIEPMADGEVPGYLLNQFSMDEHNDYFRIATTTRYVTRNWWETTSKNHVYVLDMNLIIVGKQEDLASGEKIYSARFIADRCYLVTFKKVDPLFVIDLSEPTKPTVLGKLKIPGYSDYLHPYDENHIIGVGKETIEAEEGDFAWYQGVKISLFDVNDVNNPKQIANFTIGERGTDSPVLSDHKAFLFDKSKNLLVIPVRVAEIDEDQYSGEVPPYVSGEPVWQGAFVFNITLAEGFVLRGNITHLEEDANIWDSSYWMTRTLYIEDVLYTVSNRKIKMNDLEELVPLKEIGLA